jgi:hypothetical protein
MMAGSIVTEGVLVIIMIVWCGYTVYKVIGCVILAEPLRGLRLLLVGSGLYVFDFLYPCLGVFSFPCPDPQYCLSIFD